MRLPYKKSFQSLKIVRLAIESCHATKGDLVRIYFQLSEPPPLGWAYIFTTVWRSMVYPMKRQTGVERDALWIECVPSEIATCHLRQLEYAVAQTSAIYCKEAQEQARDELSRAEQNAQIRLKLEELNQTFYPATTPSLQQVSIIVKWLRFIFPSRRQESVAPVRPGATLEPLDEMRDYHHGRFDGAAITPDGRSLSLDYFDHDPGGTRFCFRYIISVHAPPRLVSGYTHEDSRLDYEITYERIPRHVFGEARYWLTSYIEAHRDRPISKSLIELLEHLKGHGNVA